MWVLQVDILWDLPTFGLRKSIVGGPRASLGCLASLAGDRRAGIKTFREGTPYPYVNHVLRNDTTRVQYDIVYSASNMIHMYVRSDIR